MKKGYKEENKFDNLRSMTILEQVAQVLLYPPTTVPKHWLLQNFDQHFMSERNRHGREKLILKKNGIRHLISFQAYQRKKEELLNIRIIHSKINEYYS